MFLYATLIDLPRDGPHIKGQQFQYQIGETLNLNCTSGKSHPASHLQWFINDQPVSKLQTIVHPSHIHHYMNVCEGNVHII